MLTTILVEIENYNNYDYLYVSHSIEKIKLFIFIIKTYMNIFVYTYSQVVLF